MKFVYDETLTKNVVQNYFKKYEDIDGELEIKCDGRYIPPFGRSVVCHELPYISFRLKGSMEVEGEMKPVEVDVSEEEIRNAFTMLIEASGRKVKKISMDYDQNKFNCVTVVATAKRRVK